jgi:mono/diheme cytochrome c family protein
MAQWREWWGAILVGCCLLGLMSCSDSSMDDSTLVIQTVTEPTREELGLRLLPKGFNLNGLSAEGLAQVARGSYLVNGVERCNCHTTEAGYLAGGLEFQVVGLVDVQGLTTVISRNLTPDPETGMRLTEDEFIETIRTGKDFNDSTPTNPQRLRTAMPWPTYRFMAREDLQAIYAYLRRIPPIRYAVRKNFVTTAPQLPELTPLEESDPVNDPENVHRGLRIPQVFSAGAAADAFNAGFATAVGRLPPEQQAQVGRGSYLVNALAICADCHNNGIRLPNSFNINTAGYLIGGVDLGATLGLGRIFSSNLTPDPSTGLSLSEAQFIAELRFGADFRRPGSSLRGFPHFPPTYHLTLDDLKAIYAYLRAIPPVVNPIEVVP